MIALTPALSQNWLLGALPTSEAQRIGPHLDRVVLTAGRVLHAGGQAPSHAYLPTTAIISLRCGLANGGAAEFAMVGKEGIVGVPFLMGEAPDAIRAEVSCTGEAFRLPATLMREAAMLPTMSALLARHAQTLIMQAAQTAVCTRWHTLSEQLCKLLLLTQERLPTTDISMTQEAIANALGVRRESITQIAHRLQEEGLIRYARGHIQILDRPALVRRACECHGIMLHQYNSLQLPDRPATSAMPAPPPWTTLRPATTGAR